MIHENPTGRSIKVLISPMDIRHLTRGAARIPGLPKRKFIQLNFTPSGTTCTSIKPTGLPPDVRSFLERKARTYLRLEGVIK